MSAMDRTRPLAGQVALVTGGSRGIGKATALLLASQGARVAVSARDPDPLVAVVEAIEAQGSRGLGVRMDVADIGALAGSVAEIEAALGPIDILVNNAGVQRLRHAVDLTPDDWDTVLGVNLRGAFFLSQAVGRGMVARGHGRIVNLASMAAFKALPERAAYNASKAGLIMLTKSLAIEWGPLGVRVNAVAPTFVSTELSAHWLERPGVREGIEATIPNRRLPTPEQVAAAIAYLVSPDADAINGVVLPVDGGIGST